MSALDLSTEVLKGLATLSDSKLFSDTIFKAFIQVTFAILMQKEKEDKLLDEKFTSVVDIIVLKQAFSALVLLILEASKQNLDPEALVSFLEENRMSTTQRELISQNYQQNKAAIRQILSQRTFAFPHIVGVDWRLDYLMKTNQLEKINIPIYTINLKVENQKNDDIISTFNIPTATQNDVTFACTMEQLQDLLNKLKQAVKQFELHASS